MQDEPVQYSPPGEPLYDTWGGTKYLNRWCVDSPRTFTSFEAREVNEWFATTLRATLEAFSLFARPWWIEFTTIFVEGVGPVALERGPDQSDSDFLEAALQAIRQYEAPIYSLDVEVDLWVYVRTEESPEQPVRTWIRSGSQFTFYGGAENPQPSVCLLVEHSLFAPSNSYGWSNQELHALNQPLLEQALRRWEQQLSPITEVEGGDGIYQYGFRLEPSAE
jgi:hypothetical protein